MNPTVPLVTKQPHEIHAFLSRLRNPAGVRVKKHGRYGKPSEKSFTLFDDYRLTYVPSKKDNYPICIQQIKRLEKKDTKNNFLIITLNDGTALTLETDSEAECDLWIQSLSFLVRSMIQMQDEDPSRVELQHIWIAADQDANGYLDQKEVAKLFTRINLELDTDILRNVLPGFLEENGILRFDKFVDLYKALATFTELDELWDSYAKRGVLMTADEFISFMKQEQEETWEMKTTRTMFAQFRQKLIEGSVSPSASSPSSGKGSPGHSNSTMPYSIGPADFAAYITRDSRNTWWSPQSIERVTQDMNLPFTHYFVASSHNTYLTGNQINSQSSSQMYAEVLLSGCRMIEIDVWDGPDGDPIVTHGNTKTGKIPLRGVLAVINENAFQTSPYPVIISLEMHAGKSQQVSMAHMCREIFGDKIPAPSHAETTDPCLVTPEKLKGKILMKMAKIEKDAAIPAPSDDDPNTDCEIAPQLSNLIFFKAIRIRGKLKDGVVSRKPWEMVSFSEKRLDSIIEKEGQMVVVVLNKMMLSRVYPDSIRVDSGNYNPIEPWRLGCSFSALNYQTEDEWLRINEAMFRQNGRCGYVRKPSYEKPRESMLVVRVISGQSFPNPKRDKRRDIIDPFVEITLHEPATRGSSGEVSKKTKTIRNNGFHPVWNESFEFKVSYPALTFLTLTVIDKDVIKNDPVATATIPIESLRNGYRSVPLHGIESRNLLGCYLLCHFDHRNHLDQGLPV